jgi:hypothetical protein
MEPFIQSCWSLLLGIIWTKLRTGMNAVDVAAYTRNPTAPQEITAYFSQ